ncbi:MAG: hypothetical protein H7Y10_02005 [Flavobacterium sp.]|nr:hypothetical protein [Flavobacterium sp.]
MKKVKQIVGIVVVLLMTLCSCTSDPIEQVQFLKKIVEVSVDGTSNTTLLTYDGNKLVSIDKVDQLSKFYYTGDLITKVVTLDKTTQHSNTLDYSYSNIGKLTKITSSDNYVINYIHNNDGSVSYEKLTKDSNNLEVKNYHGILYFQNENLIKDERTLDDAGNGVLAKNLLNIGYDSKNNALKNILGFNKLLDYSKIISSNNEILSTAVTSVKSINDDQVISEIKRYDSEYQYNSNGYPTEIVSKNILFGGSDSNHLKSQLFYN